MNQQNIDDGGPAYPQTESLMNSGFPDMKIRETTGGLTKREWFAGMAMQGYLSDTRCPDRATPNIVAEWCVANADAMLAALKGDQQ
jgi:hypothetical protein